MKKNYNLFFASLFLFCLLTVLTLRSFSQSPNRSWSINPYDEKVFIENKGQYTNLEQELSSKILFCFEQGNTAFFLCKDQFIVREEQNGKIIPDIEKEDEEHDPARSRYPTPVFSYQRFYFENALSSVIVTGEKKSPDYNNYNLQDADGTNKVISASSFKEVVYKNIYDGIDLIFSAHENNGIEYQCIIHPSAKASLVSIRYAGNGNLQLDENGNLRAGTKGTEVIDHAPEVFYADNHAKISSAYSLNDNAYSINIGSYDHRKTIIIDPWVVNPNFTNQNKAFDIAKDSSGNVYVFGGQSPWKLKKFDSSGNPLWTFNNATSFGWYGALAVDPGGNCFITEGCCGGNILKITPAGGVAWNRTYGTDEFWRLLFNCDFSRLYLATAYASGALIHESISILDTSNGNINNFTAMFANQSEPRGLALGPTGNVYTITCTTGADSNQVAAMSPAFIKLFSHSDGYFLRYNGPLYANGGNTTSGQNAIACGSNFFCTTNGDTLYKRNLVNGVMMASTLIPAGGAETNSGILIDNCNHIFAGSSNGVVEFDSSLSVISVTPTSGEVYCLAAGKNGDLLASGNGFIASLALSVCGGVCDSITSSLPVAHFTSSDTIFCNETGQCISFTDHSTGNPTSWQWSFTGATPATSNKQNPDSICYYNPGTYAVSLIVSNGNGYDTLAANPLIIFRGLPPPPVVTAKGDTVFSTHGSSYQWYFNGAPIPNAVDSFYVASQSGTYSVQTTDSLGCSSISLGKNVIITSVSETTADDDIKVFPSPAKDQFIVYSSLFALGITFELYNIFGQKVYAEELPRFVENDNQQTINCKPFATGIYILKISAKGATINRKIIIYK